MTRVKNAQLVIKWLYVPCMFFWKPIMICVIIELCTLYVTIATNYTRPAKEDVFDLVDLVTRRTTMRMYCVALIVRKVLENLKHNLTGEHVKSLNTIKSLQSGFIIKKRLQEGTNSFTKMLFTFETSTRKCRKQSITVSPLPASAVWPTVLKKEQIPLQNVVNSP